MKAGMKAVTLAIVLGLGLSSTAVLAQGSAPPGQINVWGANLDRPNWHGGPFAPSRTMTGVPVDGR